MDKPLEAEWENDGTSNFFLTISFLLNKKKILNSF